jgi:DNA-binding CsgD family transcriptional regulator/PAS domain-containing protein
MSSILLRQRCPPTDDPEVRRLLKLTAGISGASWIELELHDRNGTMARYHLGEASEGQSAAALPLSLPHWTGVLRLGGVDGIDGSLPDLVSFSLERILRGKRSEAQVSVLRAALDTTTSAVLLFDRHGDIVYANPPADLLLSRQTEDGLEVESSGQHSQPMFMRVWSMVEKVLDGRLTELPLTSPLVLSDGSVLGCEIIRVGGEAGVHGVVVLALLQPLPGGLPNLFLEAFCARHRLSPREQEVIHLLLEGLGTSQMADRLSISEHTIRDHLKRLYRKTGTRSRSELLSVLSTARMEPANGGARR